MPDVRRRLLAGALAVAALLGPVAAGAPDARAQETTRSCDPENPQHIAPRFTNGPLEQLASPALRSRATGKGVTVAVVDSGVDVRNEHFPDGAVLPGRSFVPGYSDARDSAVAHGTAVAGIVAAREVPGSTVVGLAPDATILPVRVYVSDNPNDENPGLDPAADRIADGIRYAADEGADVVNVSMSSLEPLDALDRAVRYATRKGALVVASAGNNPEGDAPAFTQRVWPAASPGALGVTATNASGQVTDWSTHGPHVDVAAPGQQVHAAHYQAGDCQLSGDDGEPITSFATPFVSATAALLTEAHPDEGPRRIAYRIRASADRPLRDARDDVRGWGFVRPYEALTMTMDPSRPGPPFPGARQTGPEDGGGDAVELSASTDPLAGAQRQAAWWLLLGVAAVVLVLIVGRGVALAGPPTTWFGRPRWRRGVPAPREGGDEAAASTDRARESAESLVDAEADDPDEAAEQAAGRGQRDEPSFVHQPGQGAVTSPTTGSLPTLSPHLTGAAPTAERPSGPTTSAPAPSASVSGSIPLPASASGAFAAPFAEQGSSLSPSAPWTASRPDWSSTPSARPGTSAPGEPPASPTPPATGAPAGEAPGRAAPADAGDPLTGPWPPPPWSAPPAASEPETSPAPPSWSTPSAVSPPPPWPAASSWPARSESEPSPWSGPAAEGPPPWSEPPRWSAGPSWPGAPSGGGAADTAPPWAESAPSWPGSASPWSGSPGEGARPHAPDPDEAAPHGAAPRDSGPRDAAAPWGEPVHPAEAPPWGTEPSETPPWRPGSSPEPPPWHEAPSPAEAPSSTPPAPTPPWAGQPRSHAPSEQPWPQRPWAEQPWSEPSRSERPWGQPSPWTNASPWTDAPSWQAPQSDGPVPWAPEALPTEPGHGDDPPWWGERPEERPGDRPDDDHR